MNIILEYSEEQGCFHFNYGKDKENTNSYQTVAKDVDSEKASLFINKLRRLTRCQPLTFNFVKEEYNKFVVYNEEN
jgi:hypothetical protein